MRSVRLGLIFGSSLAALAGCTPTGGDDMFTPYHPPDLATTDDGGNHEHPDLRKGGGGGGDDGGGGGGGDDGGGFVGFCPDGGSPDMGKPCLPQDPDGPIVTISAPATGGIVPGATLSVTVTVMLRPGESFLDTNTIEASVPGTDVAPKRLALTATADTYVGALDVSSLPTGNFELAVTAQDLDHKVGSNMVVAIHDAGPLIHVFSPADRTYRGSSSVLFTVENPVPHDTRFDVDTTMVDAKVQTVSIMPSQPVMNQPVWQGNIDFHDTRFGQPLSGRQVLRVTASNKQGTPAFYDQPFTVDETGPAITFVAPTAGSFVGGIIDIDVQLDDQSGVDPHPLAYFGGDPTQSVTLQALGVGVMSSNHFTGRFDTRQLPSSFVLPLFTVQAQDSLGNESQQSIEVIIDNVAPAADLDPPQDMRVFKLINGVHECSQPFDPVGADATNDGDIVNQLMWLRARVEDRGNIAEGQDTHFWSGIDTNSVEVFAIPTANAPLIVDTDGDGVCDDINPLLVPTAGMAAGPNQAVEVQMQQVPVHGSPFFAQDTVSALPRGCDFIGEAGAQPPLPLCLNTPVTYDLGYTYAGNVPTIYSVPPIMDGIECQGLQFDSLNHLQDGPICVAVRARDNVGNHNVSRPLRLCLDQNGTGSCDASLYKGHASNPTLLPDCTGTLRNGQPDGSTPCQPAVKFNQGRIEPAFQPLTACDAAHGEYCPYLFM
jgi:hypothetical protein